MKKLGYLFAAVLAMASLVAGSTSAYAATVYTPTLVQLFNSDDNNDFAVQDIVPVNDSVAVVQLKNGDLWLTDGTSAGTSELSSIARDAGIYRWDFDRSSWQTPAVNDGQGTIYFWGSGDDGSVWNLWSFDGETFEQVTTSGFGWYSNTYWIDGNIYVWGRNLDPNFAASLYQVDPATGAVLEITGGNDCDGPMDENTSVNLVNGKIVFANDPENNCTYVLFAWDPANPNDAPVDIGAVADADSDFVQWDSMAVYDGELYFGGASTTYGYELWATDGSLAGTRFVKDIWPGSDSSYPGSDGYMWFTNFGGELFFNAWNQDNDQRMLYKTDGTTEGTVLTLDGLTQPGDCIESTGLEFSGQLITDFGCDLYAFDGTDAVQLTFDSGLCWTYCSVPVEFDSHVFFANRTEVTGNQLWVTDGTPDGTTPVTDFGYEFAISSESDYPFVKLGSHLLFGVADRADGGTGEMALYSLDSAPSSPAALAETGAHSGGLALAGILALLAGAAFIGMRKLRKNA